jgi:hypothetical protein
MLHVVIQKHVAVDGMLPSCCSAALGSLCISLCGRCVCMFGWLSQRVVPVCLAFVHDYIFM